MKTNDEMKDVPSFDELVFENRNKEYGAYQIRKGYNGALIWSILVSVFFISATVISPMFIDRETPIVKATPIDSVVFTPDNTIKIDIPDDPKPEPVAVKIPAYVAPEVVDSVLPEKVNEFKPYEDYERNMKNDSIVEYTPIENPEIAKEVEDNSIREIGDIPEKPYFGIGGDLEFRAWIAKNLIYPSVPLENGVQGRVYLKFVVEKDGSLSNVTVIRSVDPDLSQEAIRVVSLSPKWNPGKQNGKPVRVNFTFPIIFAIRN